MTVLLANMLQNYNNFCICANKKRNYYEKVRIFIVPTATGSVANTHARCCEVVLMFWVFCPYNPVA
ncbi:MAG: hypothetical protein IJQ20_08845, partial [Paludibacteraceae bacterium]|nr:hypothetical protein [Paludibacteraceae bacterium]